MKKILILFSITVFFFSKAQSQEALEEGSVIFSAGYGFPSLIKLIVKSQDSAFHNQNSNTHVAYYGYGPIHLKGEWIITEKVGLSGVLNYTDFTRKQSYNQAVTKKGTLGVTYYTIHYQAISVLARINMHLITTKKADLYFGVGLGYNSRKLITDGNAPNLRIRTSIFPMPLAAETSLGFRYYLTPHLGLYSEFGITKSVIQGGVFYKL